MKTKYMLRGTLRAKFLLSLATISTLLTWATLLLVRQRVELHVREEIQQGLRNSVLTFQVLQQEREVTLERSASLLAALPPLKAVMTSQHAATIQDASSAFWTLAGSQLFVLADGSGRVLALHTSTPSFTEERAQEAFSESMTNSRSRDWWFGEGHLFEVFLQRIYFGSPEDNIPMGILAVGYQIDDDVAAKIGRVASGKVAFQYNGQPVVSTLEDLPGKALLKELDRLALHSDQYQRVDLGNERFLATSVGLSVDRPVVLTVLKSFDESTQFLNSLNRWIIGIGITAVIAGSLLVFVVSTTFTRPLAALVEGVRALEKGDYSFPLSARGNDEVSILTRAFQQMRIRLQETQTKLIDTERFATIGRMASMISHDLRHPLTAILAYAEFLSEGNLTEVERRDFYEEIRIAVNRMTDEVSSLLGFSKQKEGVRPIHACAGELIERAIQTVKVLPEHQGIAIQFSQGRSCEGWFDPAKLERAILNLLFNACEAVSHETGKIEITCSENEGGLEIFVADNGPGIPASILDNLFQPFVSYGKEKGTGLGLTVVHKIMQDHGGEVAIERSGSSGTMFKLVFPRAKAPAIRSQPAAFSVGNSGPGTADS